MTRRKLQEVGKLRGWEVRKTYLLIPQSLNIVTLRHPMVGDNSCWRPLERAHRYKLQKVIAVWRRLLPVMTLFICPIFLVFLPSSLPRTQRLITKCHFVLPKILVLDLIPILNAYICLFQNSSDKPNINITFMWIWNNESDIFFFHPAMLAARVWTFETKSI